MGKLIPDTLSLGQQLTIFSLLLNLTVIFSINHFVYKM